MLFPKVTPSTRRHVNSQVITIRLVKYKEGQECHGGEGSGNFLRFCFPTSCCIEAQPLSHRLLCILCSQVVLS